MLPSDSAPKSSYTSLFDVDLLVGLDIPRIVVESRLASVEMVARRPMQWVDPVESQQTAVGSFHKVD
jgi:hypothetical protein